MLRKDFELLKSRGITFREATLLNASYNSEERSIETVIATENPAIVIDWEKTDWHNLRIMREILIIDNESVIIPESRQIPFLDSHRTWDGSDSVKGSIRELNAESGKVAGRTFISSTEEKLAKKIEERHLTNVSAGYDTFKEFTHRVKPGESVTVKGREFKNEYPDKLDLVIRSKWSLLEGSSVVWGADEFSTHRNKVAEVEPKDELISKLNAAEERISQLENNISIKSKENREMENELTPEQRIEAERRRSKEIRETSQRFVGRINGVDKLRDTAIDEGWSQERFNAEVVTRLSAGEEFQKPPSDLDLDGKDKKRYSIWNLVRAKAEKNPEIAAHEIAVSREIAKRLGVEPRGAYIEYGHLKREITIGTGTADKLVGVELRATNFLDLLYNKMIFGKALNVKMINGLIGDLDFPRKTSSSSGYYIGEGDVATESDINFGLQRMSPKTVSAKVIYSRQTSLQTTPEMEGLVLEDVVNAIKLRADLSYIQGLGGEEILGLLNIDGVQTHDGANFGFDTAVDMEAKLENANIDMDAAKWLTTPLGKAILRKRKIEAGQTDKLWEKERMLDRIGFASKQLPEGSLVLVEATDIIVGTWGVLDIQINRWNDDGSVKVIPFWSHDMINRRPHATVKVTNLS
jgi:hypothetical protein